MKQMRNIKRITAALIGFGLLWFLAVVPVSADAADFSEKIKSIKIQIYNIDDTRIYDKEFVFNENDLASGGESAVLFGADAQDMIYDNQKIGHIHIKLEIQDDYLPIISFRTLIRFGNDLTSKVVQYDSVYHYDWTLYNTDDECDSMKKANNIVIYVSDKNGERVSEYIVLTREGKEAIIVNDPTAAPTPTPSASPEPENTPTETADMGPNGGWGDMPSGAFPTIAPEETNTSASPLTVILIAAAAVVVIAGAAVYLIRRAKKRQP